MKKIWGALAEAASLIVGLFGTTYATRLYPEYSTTTVSALNSVLGALFFGLTTPLWNRARKKRASKTPWSRKHWMLALCLLPTLIQGQLYQPALERVGVGKVVAITTLGPLCVSAWRLVLPEGGPVRPRHVVWPLIAVGGIVFMTRPFSGGSDVLGLAAAGAVAVIGGVSLIVSGKLTDLGGYPRAVVLQRWSTALFVGTPILVLTGEHWMTWRALSTVAVSTALIIVGAWLHIYALDLSRSDGVIGTASSLKPVFALLVGLIVASQVPGLYGWVGAGLVVLASIAAIRLLSREGGRVDPADGAWKTHPGTGENNDSAWIPVRGAWSGGPRTWKQDGCAWKHALA
ncbi:EamA family transporter [Spirillospora sp. CA-128828]|uniref:EamA family transporter n=1 Tax=Spirillospora sp. CA-128828 TaxID=3240033 RepID=UPI003D8FD3AF